MTLEELNKLKYYTKTQVRVPIPYTSGTITFTNDKDKFLTPTKRYSYKKEQKWLESLCKTLK